MEAKAWANRTSHELNVTNKTKAGIINHTSNELCKGAANEEVSQQYL